MYIKDKTILIVEDDSDIRQTMSMIFEVHGWKVYQAGEGHEALELYEKYRPIVILTDINMPHKADGSVGMDGIEFINILNEKYNDQKPMVFVNSGFISNSELTNKINSVLAYFSKPTLPSKIISSMEEIIKKERGCYESF